MNSYTQHPEVLRLVESIHSKGLDTKIYSDLIDEQNHQYVDLVQEGGGVLGIALVGYTYILEKAGIRFFSLAGTSAGAINTMMMAGLARVGEPVSEKVLTIMSSKNLFDFVDGNTRLKKLVQDYIEDRPFFKLRVAFNALLIWKTLKENLGFNPGNDFEKWVDFHLSQAGVTTMADLHRRRQELPVLMDRTSREVLLREAAVKIITSDVTTKSKITFPEMAELYWAEPETVHPSCFVRASMSIPFFFNPFQVNKIPHAGTTEDPNLPKESTRWRKHTGYRGPIPETVRFVDGGMLSNFPINAFHMKSGMPKKPTFGARLSTWRDACSKSESIGGLCGAMISTMRQLHDYDFLLKNEDYKQLICSIDADAKHDAQGKDMFNWLDFNMPEEKRLALFTLGAEKAIAFLEGFNWDNYKRLRSGVQTGKME
ncbi:MAG: patatin-like phospholipase family protein [Bacteroidales bacterium]|nr:patatin-like phospholipase family protein [Bacteroidales bacterium]